MPKAKIESVKVADLILDKRLQFRKTLTNPDHLADMVEAVRAKAKLPRPKVRRVDGKLFVTDGFHTVTAHAQVHYTARIECDVADGTWYDAVCDAAAAHHPPASPLKYTREEKRAQVAGQIEANRKEGEKWPLARLAAHCHVSETLVRAVLADMPPGPEAEETPAEPVFTTRKDGRRQPAKVARKAKAEPAAPKNGEAAKPAYDWKAFEAAMGVVQRAPDDAARTNPELKGTTEYQGVTRLLGELAEAFGSFKKAARAPKQEK